MFIYSRVKFKFIK